MSGKLYPGTKSVDAEIKIDFIDSCVVMDYTRNFGQSADFDSNSGVYYNSDWDDEGILPRLKQATLSAFLLCFQSFIVLFLIFPVSVLQSKGILVSPKYQVGSQKFRKWVCSNIKGVVEVITKISTTRTVLHIPNNLWVEYELSESAKGVIASIELLRHFDNYYRFGKWHEIRQNGWDVIFTFSSLPENSYVLVKYVA